MLKTKRSALFGALALGSAVLMLAGCATTDGGSADTGAAELITIETNLGEAEVPVLPERVVALDNTAFDTLREWGITPVAVPKGLLPAEGFEDWIEDEGILDIGNHREPQLELVSEAAPDLILGGYRFAPYQDDLASIAPTIDIAASEEHADGYVASLKVQTATLGQIFDRSDEATEIVADLDAAIAAAADATDGESVFLAVVNGGKIDNGADRIGRLLEPLTLVDVFAGEEGDIHGDSGLAPETIAQANPDWAIVLDRDAATTEALPAEQIFSAQEAFAATTFMLDGQVIYLDPFFYTREGIQAYTEAFDQIADAFTAS